LSDYVEKLLNDFRKSKVFASKHLHTANETPKVNVIPTGLDELDHAVLSIGGIPRGRATQLWGPYESGKSTLAGFIVSQMQKRDDNVFDGTAALFDSEGKFVNTWWDEWGVDSSKLLIGDFSTGEEAYAQIRALIGKVDIIILDSIAGLVSQEEAARDIDSAQRLGSSARMNESELTRVVNGTLRKDGKGKLHENSIALKDSPTALIFINQIRANIGMLWGRSEKRKGGHSLDHLSSLILRIDKIGIDKDRDRHGGVKRQKVRIRCERSNFSPSMRSCDYWLNLVTKKFEPIDGSFIVNMGIDIGLIENRGAWYYSDIFPEGKLHGMESVNDWLNTEEGKVFAEKIKNKSEDIDISQEELEELEGVD